MKKDKGTGKSKGTEIKLVAARPGGRGEWEVTANGPRVSFCGDEYVVEFDSADGYTIL